MILDLAFINWGIGLLLLIASNASGQISPKVLNRNGWRKYIRGYSIKEIKIVIGKIEDEKVKMKLQRKIILRRIGYLMLISTPILIIIGNS